MKLVHAILLFIATSLFSLNLPLGKVVLQSASPLMMQMLKSAITAILVAPFLEKMPRRALIEAFLLASLLFSVCHSLSTMAVEVSTNLNLMGFLNMLESPLAVALGILFLRERLPRGKVVGLLICMLALWITADPQFEAEATGVALMLASILCGALGKVLLRKRLQGETSTQLMLWALFFSSFQFAGGALLFDSLEFPSHAQPYLVLGAMSILGLIYFVVWSYLQERYTVSRLSPFSLLMIFTLPAANYIVLGHSLTQHDILAGLILLPGLALLMAREPKAT